MAATSQSDRLEVLHAFAPLTIDTDRAATAQNPSAWRPRLPIVVLAFAATCIAGYLAAYQFGAIRNVWEPFFGDGSRKVLHSFISRALPLPDAALGAAGYFAECAAALVGGARRWRTAPWIVIIYGVIVAALAATAILLALVQAFVIHAACTLCLCSAAISLAIAWRARPEVFAALDVVYEKRKNS